MRIGQCFAVECRTSPQGRAGVDAALIPVLLAGYGLVSRTGRELKLGADSVKGPVHGLNMPGLEAMGQEGGFARARSSDRRRSG
jgi:hypothetical protein